MRKLKQMVHHPIFWGAGGIFLGAIIVAIITVFAFIYPLQTQNQEYLLQVQNLQAENTQTKETLEQTHTQLKQANEELGKTTEDLNQTKGDLDATKEDLQISNEERDQLKNDIEAKQAELNQLDQKMAGVQNELNQKQTALAKAQRGVQQLQKLDASFTTFDRASDEAMNILMQFYNAINNNDIVAAQSYEQKYIAKADEANAAYENIMKLLNDFRNGNY